jgi:DNA/RNA endonuclease YhcR with UshA esterase domain
MKRRMTGLFGLVLTSAILIAPAIVTAQESISAADAAKYVGRKATVCGIVASATFSSRTEGQPTFLDLDQPSPRQTFTAVIWGEDRSGFSSSPEVAYRGKRICVTGLVKSHRGKPEIIVHRPGQIVVKSE